MKFRDDRENTFKFAAAMMTWSISTVKTNRACSNLSENRFERLYRYLKLSLTFSLMSYRSFMAFQPSAVVVCYPSRKSNAWFHAVYHLIHQKLTKQSKQKHRRL